MPLRAFVGLAVASLSLAVPAEAATACEAAAPIREESFVPVGGIEQWVTISGTSCGNPAILILHGGPGNPMSPYSGAIYGPWEKDFTIVQWDQRGAGRTFGRNPGAAEEALTIERMTADGIEVAEYLRKRLGKEKLILVGGSWGSVLGVHMVKARPDLFHAYVGTGQMVSYRRNQEASYRRTLDLARAAGDAETVATIEALGPPPWANPRNFGILRRATRKYEARTAAVAPEGWWKPAPLYATPEAMAAYEGGEEYSFIQFVGMNGDGMFSGVELAELGTRFEIPILLVQGADDLVTVPEVARAYFDTIDAPAKQFVLLPKTGHDPNRAMTDSVHRLLKARFPSASSVK